MRCDVAIVGVAALLPGASDIDELWANLIAGRDCVREVDDAELVIDRALAFDPRRGVPDRTPSLLGGWIGTPPIDPGLPPHDPRMESLGRLLSWPLAVARDALRDARAVDGDLLARCGLVLGGYPWGVSRASQQMFGALYDEALGIQGGDAVMPAEIVELLLSGNLAPLVAGALGLGGPHYSIDAACATLLYAIKLAALHLRAGDADAMLAGCSSAYDPLFSCLGFATLQALPQEARSRPLDAESDGLAPAEGCCMFVLKRHEDALRAGDRIHAVVRSVGLSSDGRGQHVLAPGQRGQVAAYERAYAESGVDPAATAYIECHATGTHVGDRVEIAGIGQFFGLTADGPLLGSVKSNLGHLLTAAGGASLIKAMLALRRGEIPATIGVSTPLALDDGTSIESRLVREARAWPDRSGPRQAAVNAFGFGGTNAHLVLQGPDAEQAVGADRLAVAPMAIVGMDGTFGGADGLDAFARRAFSGPAALRAPLAGRMRGLGGGRDAPDGVYLDDFEVDALRYQIPPRELQRLSAQHLLLLAVADRALMDARLEPGGRVAVLVALAAEASIHRLQARWELPGRPGVEAGGALEAARDSLHQPAETGDFVGYIGNLAASRVAALWDFSGPAFAVAGGEFGTQRCLQLAALMLAAGEADAVVVGAVDLAGAPESILLRDVDGSGASPIGEGAGAVVLRRVHDAVADGQAVYATVQGIRFEQAPDDPDARASAAGRDDRDEGDAEASRASAAGRQDRDEGEASRASAAGRQDRDEGEASRASAAGRDDRDEGDTEASRASAAGRQDRDEGDAEAGHLETTDSSARQFGHAFAAAGMTSLLRAALCVSQRCLPGAGAARPWLGQRASRVAHVHGRAIDGSRTRLVVKEAADALRHATRPVSQAQAEPLLILPTVGDCVQEVIDGIGEIESQLAAAVPLAQLAQQAIVTAAAGAGRPLAACLVGRSGAELRSEAQLALSNIRATSESGQRWQTPAGSVFAPQPLGGDGLTFVYPGVNAMYPGASAGLFAVMPELHDRLGDLFRSPADAMCADLLFAQPSTAAEREQLEERLTGSTDALLKLGALLPSLCTWVLRDCIGLSPGRALGYSFGEVSMMLALGFWRPGDDWLARLASAEVVHVRLAGPRACVREHWRMPPGDELDWASYVVLAERELVEGLTELRDDVYLTNVCAPNEVVIAGRAASCQALVAEGDFDAFRVPGGLSLHCPPALAERARLKSLLSGARPGEPPDIELYLAAAGDPPDAIAAALCEQADFPEIVERAYGDGARVFVDVGPGATCSRWIQEILKGRPHMAAPATRRGVDDATTVARLVATLVAERVPLDLARWAAVTDHHNREPSRLPLTVRLGGPPIRALRPTPVVAADPAVVAAEHPMVTAEPAVVASERAMFAPEAAVDAAERPMVAAEPAMVAAEPAMVASERAMFAPEAAVDAAEPPIGTAERATVTTEPAVVATGLARSLAGQSASNAATATLVAEAIAGARRATAAHRTMLHESDRLLRAMAVALGDGARRPGRPVPLLGEVDMLEFAEGRLEPLFGPKAAEVDSFRRRVRFPGPPFLAVSRVTRLDAEWGRLGPGSITTEFDIPEQAWHGLDDEVSYLTLDAQGVLLLVSAMGIDLENRGERGFRWLDATITFFGDMPRAGETIQYDIEVTSFAREGDALIFFSEYEGRVGGRRVTRIDGCCAGFFSDQELSRGQGITDSHRARRLSPAAAGASAAGLPLACGRRSFGPEHLEALHRGDLEACFGATHAAAPPNPALRLPVEPMRMIDRVIAVDPVGGARSLGTVVAEQDLRPSAWYLRAHFKDDPVFAGPCMLEASFQILQFLALFGGLHTLTEHARFQQLDGRPLSVCFRAQVPRAPCTVVYRVEVVERGIQRPQPYLVADVEIEVGGCTIGRFEGAGVRIAPSPRSS